MAHGGGRQIDQICAVVERDQLHSMRKQTVVQIFHFLFKLFQRRNRLFATLQEHDSFDRVIVVVHAHLSQPRLRSFMDVRQVAQVDWNAIAFGDQNALHVLNRLQQADAAHIHALAAHRQIAAAGICVARRDRRHDLRKRKLVLQQLARIDFGDIGARAAAETCHIDDARHLLDLARNEPVLRGLEFVQAVARAIELVAVNLSDGRFGRKLRA